MKLTVRRINMIRFRLLVYNGPEDWMQRMRDKEYVQDKIEFAGKSIESHEIDPDKASKILDLIKTINEAMEIK